MGVTNVIYVFLAIVLHLEVPNCPLILLPCLFPKEDLAIIDVYHSADNA